MLGVADSLPIFNVDNHQFCQTILKKIDKGTILVVSLAPDHHNALDFSGRGFSLVTEQLRYRLRDVLQSSGLTADRYSYGSIRSLELIQDLIHLPR